MHELSITQGVVDICQSTAAGRRVISVTLQIGELSGVVPEAIEFCFEACTRETPLEGALLIIEAIPARGRCRSCSAEFPLRSYYSSCPDCGGHDVNVISGQEMRVKEMEVE